MVLMTSASLTAIPPFFEPGAPPPTLPILIAQTEVGSVGFPTRLLAQEEIGSGPTIARSAHSSAKCMPRHKSTSKQPWPTTKPHHTDDPVGSDGDASDSELTSLDSDLESEDSHLIPKPEGEAGRPGRGGYNLEKALKWERQKYIKIKKYVKKLVEQYLEPAKNFISQSASAIRVVQQMAAMQFPELRDYADLWPVSDMVKLNLKYTSGRARLNDRVYRGLAKRQMHQKQ